MQTRFLALVSTVCLASLVGCDTMRSGNLVQIGSTKVGLFGLPPEYRALHPGLEKALGAQVRFNAQPNGRAVGQQLQLGNLQYALLTCKEYADVENTSNLKVIAAAVNSEGKTARKGLIVSKKSDARIQGISDCKDKRFAFGTYGDVLTDKAAKRALEKGGCPPSAILLDLMPPPFGILGRLYMGNDACKTVSFDATVNAGIVDEIVYSRLPENGGNFIIGPSKDMLNKIGETEEIPEMVVVAGPKADAAVTQRLAEYLINSAKGDKNVCDQLGIKGFAAADASAYEAVREWLSKMPKEEPAPGKAAAGNSAIAHPSDRSMRAG